MIIGSISLEITIVNCLSNSESDKSGFLTLVTIKAVSTLATTGLLSLFFLGNIFSIVLLT